MTHPHVFPMFPLESVLLVPGALLPLHIFEPRYRDLVKDALDGDRMIAMAMPREGHATSDESTPPVHPVVHVGRIVHDAPYDDGRRDIVLEGVARMRIDRELPSERAYRVVHAVPLPDATDASEGDVRDALEALLARFPELRDEELEGLRGLPVGGACDVVLLRLPLPAREKHRIHAEPDPILRIDAVHGVLDVLRGRTPLRLRRGDPRLN